jgi:DME family drug/metabolite transporter
LSTGLYQMTFLYSVSRTGAALATVVALGIAPVATGVCARWLTGEQVGIAWLVSTSGAVGGCALLLSPSSGRVDNVGLLLGGVAGICYGAYTAFAKKLATENPTLHVPTAAAASLVVGGLLLLPWMALDTSGLADLRTAGLVGWLGVATTAAAYWMFTAGLGRVSATAAGTLSLAEPLAASLLGVLVLGEDLSGTDLAGSLLLLGGLAGASLPNLRRGAWRVGTEQKAETVGKRLDH